MASRIDMALGDIVKQSSSSRSRRGGSNQSQNNNNGGGGGGGGPQRRSKTHRTQSRAAPYSQPTSDIDTQWTHDLYADNAAAAAPKAERKLFSTRGGARGGGGGASKASRGSAFGAGAGAGAGSRSTTLKSKPTSSSLSESGRRKVMTSRGLVLGYQIQISNLAYEVSGDDLLDVFNEFGEIVAAEVQLDDDGNSTGKGIVVFRRSNDAQNAAETYNGERFMNRPMRIAFDQSNESTSTSSSSSSSSASRTPTFTVTTTNSKPLRGGRGGSGGRFAKKDAHRDRDQDDEKRGSWFLHDQR